MSYSTVCEELKRESENVKPIETQSKPSGSVGKSGEIGRKGESGGNKSAKNPCGIGNRGANGKKGRK